MRSAHIRLTVAILSVSALIAACGTPAPSPNNSGSGTTKSSGSSGAAKTGTSTKTGSSTSNTSKNAAGTAGKGSTKSASGGNSGANTGSTTHNMASGSGMGGWVRRLGITGRGSTPNNSHRAGGSGSMSTRRSSANRAGTKAAGGLGAPINTARGGANKARRTINSAANRRRTAGATKTISLTTLPTMTQVTPFNPHMRAYHEVSSFVNEMGYHWVTPVPGIVFMTNQHNQITGVEATFPQNLGDFSWYDPPTPPSILNASLAFYSEHLYFVPETSITSSMSPTMTTSLTSWAQFMTTNTRLKTYVKEPFTFHGYTVYGPPNGPGILVLVSSSGVVSGFCVAEPATWGYSPLYASNNGRPYATKVYSQAYYSVFMLEPSTMAVSGGTTKSTGT